MQFLVSLSMFFRLLFSVLPGCLCPWFLNTIVNLIRWNKQRIYLISLLSLLFVVLESQVLGSTDGRCRTRYNNQILVQESAAVQFKHVSLQSDESWISFVCTMFIFADNTRWVRIPSFIPYISGTSFFLFHSALNNLKCLLQNAEGTWIAIRWPTFAKH